MISYVGEYNAYVCVCRMCTECVYCVCNLVCERRICVCVECVCVCVDSLCESK